MEILGDTELHENPFSDYLVIDIFLYPASDTSPCINLKAIKQLSYLFVSNTNGDTCVLHFK